MNNVSQPLMMYSQGILLHCDRVSQEEFDYWKTRDNCRLDMRGDDQSIHNYLYYTNRFKNAVSIKHREGPLHVVGVQAAKIWENATKEGKAVGINGKWQEWLSKEHGLIDPHTGMILNMDGSPSPQVHQVDRFGSLNSQWLQKMNEMGWPYNTPPHLQN
jgi:hypothetical protein